jgi:hypothetical protein
MAMAFFGQQALAADAPPKIDPKVHDQSIKDAGPLVMQSGLDCALADAYLVTAQDEKVNGKTVKTSYYEISCGGGLGYLFKSAPAIDPVAFNCLSLKESAEKAIAEKKKPGVTCGLLPANADPKQGLNVWLQRAKVPCPGITRGEYIGSNLAEKIDVFEAVCSDDSGYYIQAPGLGSTAKLMVGDCTTGTKCSLITPDEIKNHIYKLAAPANRTACMPNNARYVGTSPQSGEVYYEIGCVGETPGFMFTLDKTGAFGKTIECGLATRIGDGCSYTNASAGQTDDIPTYQKLATQIGLTDCTVSKYQSYGADQATQREIAELACSNRPDGVFAFLPTGPGQTGQYLNCLRATSLGMACHLSPLPATYAKISAQIAARGKTTCPVDGGKGLGKTADGKDYVVVSCGAQPALVLTYSRLPEETLIGAVPCAQSEIAGACDNLKK